MHGNSLAHEGLARVNPSGTIQRALDQEKNGGASAQQTARLLHSPARVPRKRNVPEVVDRPITERWKDIVQHVKDEYLSTAQSYPWIVGFSGGKDSTVVAHAVFEALRAIPPSQRTRPVHIVSND